MATPPLVSGPAEVSPGILGSRGLLRRFYPPVLAGVLLLVAWELVVWWFELPNYVLPTPREIVSATANDPRVLLHDAMTTLGEALGGYIAGSLLGLFLAFVFVGLPVLGRLLTPLYVTINSVPMVAYGPLAIIWFGIGSLSKVVLIIIAVSYTILVNTLAGLRSCDPASIALLRSFGAGRRSILLKLRIPTALPWIFAGLRVAVVHAMILAIVLEMLGANAGLGWSIFKSTQMMSFVDAWVAVAVSVCMSLAIYSVVTWASRRAVWW